MEKKPIAITTTNDVITQIADGDGNRVIIQLDKNDVPEMGVVYLNHSKLPSCTLNKAEIDDLKFNLQMPVKLAWQPVSEKPNEFNATYFGPAQVVGSVCTKSR